MLSSYENWLKKTKSISESSWIDIIVDSLIELSGKATLTEIYNKVAELYPKLATGTYQNTIRARIYENSSDSKHFRGSNDLFYSENKGDGVWGLRSYQFLKIAEEVDNKNLVEGSLRTISVNAYERNAKARKNALIIMDLFAVYVDSIFQNSMEQNLKVLFMFTI